MGSRGPFGPHVCGRSIGYGNDRCMAAPGHSGTCPKRAPRERVTVRLLGGTPPEGTPVEGGEWTATVTRAALQDLVEESGAMLVNITPPAPPPPSAP